jgi:hypothetical protein
MKRRDVAYWSQASHRASPFATVGVAVAFVPTLLFSLETRGKELVPQLFGGAAGVIVAAAERPSSGRPWLGKQRPIGPRMTWTCI